ncbi:MAG: DUF2281 domain-containing protein [Plectolyngbya sp. WJT66-NPBG17]|jgi:hypothetical protein|nr:DUF2281 domain-containing protein [Plectolyngbya sp. WJT66-NPBG17]MBW4528153.1 DUF2281 domain-containing protein [Phormidium tanganyikae FI6-MK23]
MTIAEQIYTIAKNLPPDQASEILAFAESIRSKHSTSIDSELPNEQVISSQTWADLVRSLAGTWAEDFPTLEEIRAEEGQDVLRESL